MKLATAVLTTCLALPAGAATLRPYTTLSSGVVKLSDLFEGADGRPLGPGPAPGGRITVEASQLSAIARMFAVEWHSAGPGDRAVLERPGRSLSKGDVMAPLRELLEGAGAPRDCDVELGGFTTPPLPTETPPSLDFAEPSYDSATGRFTTLLTATADGIAPVQVRLSGRVQEMTELPVAKRAMRPGDVVGPDDLQWARLRVGLARGEMVQTVAQAEGQAVRRALQPGQPIGLADLGRPVVVTKGTPLMLSLQGAGIELTAQGVAQQPGGLGERIHVLNPYSQAVVEAEVTGPRTARVVPESRPQLQASVP